ncbi:UrcA family protein [Sphingomonas sp. KR3-1]|uniref:UrcA family protein n=1 Tax=Sphingomonas sp. KR3-1 TaxID=3156611 RepID=UPI0032B5121F
MKTLLIAAALLAFPTAPAFAQNSVTIHYNTAKLTTAAGRAALQRQVKLAAVRACGTDRVPGSALPSSQVRACYKNAAMAARPQVERAIALANRGADVASAR